MNDTLNSPDELVPYGVAEPSVLLLWVPMPKYNKPVAVDPPMDGMEGSTSTTPLLSLLNWDTGCRTWLASATVVAVQELLVAQE